MAICQEETTKWWRTVCEDGKISEQCKRKFYVATDNEDYAALKVECKRETVNTEAAIFGPLKAGSTPGVSERSAEVV
eukprot:2572764-Amphidinium_carterae.1